MIRIAHAAPKDYEAALELLFDRLAPDERRISVKDVLRSLSSSRITRHGLLTAWNEQGLLGSILYAIQRDRTAFVWPPRTCGPQVDQTVADLLVSELRAGVEVSGAWIAQALLDPAARDDAEALDRNGFERLTDLRFLVHLLPGVQVNAGARSWDVHGKRPSPPAPQGARGEDLDATRFSSLPSPLSPGARGAGGEGAPRRNLKIDCERITFQPGVHDERFARLLERTYVGTRDCPEVGGRRSGADALVSHQVSGEFDPARWTLYRVGGKDAGALLLNAHPEHSAWEVVYVGVSHDCRGLGLGRRMMLDALDAARAAGQSALLLAVDSRNDYASKVYDELGFVETDRKGVHVYFPTTRGAT
jgi:GNAT superfamily N-acetyltransferase